MADTLHHLSLLHGNRPSVFEVVAQSALVPAPEWLNAAMRAFAGERDLMSRLMVAAGPPPSRLGQTSVQERSEEHTSELQSLMRNSYAVFRLKKKKKKQMKQHNMTKEKHTKNTQ